ncbi:hypothetical protein D9613_009762 [Agrocybe pediades]|uniref:F-box domain-containing protein n=1 Tax=Agrocybe pediades TaxID=84607 RepID=A0A8H4QXI0_9AGAR|nr:hypothetical protein D9613_009762 [Agrocybe pediades]
MCWNCVGHSDKCIDPASSLDYIKSVGGCPFASDTCEPCQALPDLEKEIKQTTDYLKNLLSRHRALRTQVNHRHSAIIRKFPVEILCRIFQECQPVLDDLFDLKAEIQYRYRGFISKIDFPLKLGAVCRTWRQIAWSTQNLWTRICVKLSGINIDEPYLLNQCSVLEGYIHRSGRLPLEVYIWGKPLPILEKVRGYGMVCLQVVARCADRWRDLDLDLEREWLRYLFSQATQVTRSFELRKFVCTRASDGIGVPDTGALLETWPHFTIKPQQFILAAHWPGREDHLDWSGLTHLQVTNWSWNAWLDVFRKAPYLIFCKLDAYAEPFSGNTVTPSSENHMQLKHLQQLSVSAFDGRPSRILDLLTAPRLQGFHYESSEDACTLLTSFMGRSQCSLTRLDLRTKSFATTESLISFLDLTPSLEDLTLNLPLYDYADTIKSLFQRCSKSNTFLPNLESLTCNGGHYFPWDVVPHVFGPPSDFKNPGKRPMKSLTVTERERKDLGPIRIAQDVVARLIELRNAGAAITYNSRAENFEITTMRWEDYL